MIIKITSPTEEKEEKVFYFLKKFCIENFKEFELSIEDKPEFIYKQEKKHETS
jgi:hypothetical protein